MNTSRARILIVDDDQVLVKMIARALTRHDFQVLTAFDGLQGLAMTREETPDLVILDIEMPRMDGYEVCRRLQLEDGTRSIPVLMLTAKGDIPDYPDSKGLELGLREQAEGLDAGALEFLTKPVTIEQLVEHINSLLWFASIGEEKQ